MSLFVNQVAQIFKSGTRSLATVRHQTIKSAAIKSKVKPVTSSKPKKQQKEPEPPKSTYSERLYKLVQKGIEEGKPHFRVGGKKLYFPTARVVLLRPNARHTPYQAKFIVPKSFNKTDLRDYLYHLYGLRVVKVTTQLLPGEFTRDGAIARYRTAQTKKMTVDLLEPFIWPTEPKQKDEWNIQFMEDLKTYSDEAKAFGSDRNKPGTAFNGALGPYEHRPEPFVPKWMKKRLINLRNEAKSIADRTDNEQLVTKYLQL